MAQRSIRFGIRDDYGNRAATWKLWTESSRGDSDFYLTGRSLGGSVKVSFHQSGEWHFAYTLQTFEEKLKGLASAPKDRFIERWTRPSEIADGVVSAFRIVTPFSATTCSTKAGEFRKMIWLPNAPKPLATEIAILITRQSLPLTDWPGKHSMKTSLVGSLPLANGDIVWAIYWLVVMPSLPEKLGGSAYFYRGKSQKDLNSQVLRALALSSNPDGSRVIYDLAVRSANLTPER